MHCFRPCVDFKDTIWPAASLPTTPSQSCPQRCGRQWKKYVAARRPAPVGAHPLTQSNFARHPWSNRSQVKVVHRRSPQLLPRYEAWQNVGTTMVFLTLSLFEAKAQSLSTKQQILLLTQQQLENRSVWPAHQGQSQNFKQSLSKGVLLAHGHDNHSQRTTWGTTTNQCHDELAVHAVYDAAVLGDQFAKILHLPAEKMKMF